MNHKFLKWIGVSITSILVSLCASCGTSSDDGKIDIIATIFPEYDWVMNVVGDKKEDINVKLLLDNGVDLHSYQPSFKDITSISKCDLFIYVGGESDEWVEDVLKDAKNKDMLTINLMDVLGDKKKEEELIEGMEGEEEEEEEEEVEYDEHVWLSLKNAELFVNTIADAIGKLDVENASYYKANATSYVANLVALDAQYAAAVAVGSKNTVVFADRFPFRYLVDDYNLKYYAAFVGCSAEANASFKTIAFLAGKVDELGLNVILIIESSDGGIANSVKEATTNKNQQIMVMDSIQSATTKEYKSGRNYLSIMTKNLDVLKEAIK